MKKRLPFIIAAILATLWIFTNSMQTADISTVSSDRIVNAVNGVLTHAGVTVNRDMLVTIVRKCAHMAEFTLQAILIAFCFKMPYKRRIIYIFFLGLLTACADEYIQYFVPGRASMLKDVFIDFVGTLCGTAIAGISCGIKRR